MTDIIVAITLSVAMLYAWAGFCYLLLRHIRSETAEGQRRFLEAHHKFFTVRAFGESRRQVTPATIREAGRRGWVMTGLPIMVLSFGLTLHNVLASCAVLFFGGLMFAYSWYGLRCLRMLGMEVYAPEAARARWWHSHLK